MGTLGRKTEPPPIFCRLLYVTTRSVIEIFHIQAIVLLNPWPPRPRPRTRLQTQPQWHSHLQPVLFKRLWPLHPSHHPATVNALSFSLAPLLPHPQRPGAPLSSTSSPISLPRPSPSPSSIHTVLTGTTPGLSHPPLLRSPNKSLGSSVARNSLRSSLSTSIRIHRHQYRY